VTGVLGALLLPERLRIWGVYGLSCLLLFAFGTTSWRSYQPLPLASRMALPCVPGLVLCSAYFLSELRLVAVSSRWRADALLLALLVLMRVEPLVKFVASWTPNLEAQAIKHVRRQLRAAGGRKLLVVTADQRSAKYLLAYFGFHEPAQAHFVYAGNLTEAMASAVDGAVLFSNSGLSAYLQRAYGARPYEPEFAAGHVMPIYDTHGFTVRVLDKPALLELTKRVVSP
jgi:hypothetical protein